jgi:hypothetical protein
MGAWYRKYIYKINPVIAVRVTKPRIPEKIKENYEQMEGQKTKYLIEIERQRVLEKESETLRKQTIIKAQTEAEVSKIQKEMEIHEFEAKKKIQDIENQMYMDKQKAIADADDYMIRKEIDANNKRLTPEYLKYLQIIHMTNSTKFYFGESIPKYLGSNNLLLNEK